MLGAVILAGGKSSRFGSNKAFAKIKGKELILWCIEGLSEIVEEIVLSVKKYDEVFRKLALERIKIVEDLSSIDGPLVGLYSSLKAMSSKYVYIQPVDSPYVIKDYVNFMFKSAMNSSACVVTFDDGSFDPTHSVIEKEIALKYSKELIDKGETSLKRLFITMPNVKFVKLSEINLPFIEKVFVNINTKEDLEKELR